MTRVFFFFGLGTNSIWKEACQVKYLYLALFINPMAFNITVSIKGEKKIFQMLGMFSHPVINPTGPHVVCVSLQCAVLS